MGTLSSSDSSSDSSSSGSTSSSSSLQLFCVYLVNVICDGFDRGMLVCVWCLFVVFVSVVLFFRRTLPVCLPSSIFSPFYLMETSRIPLDLCAPCYGLLSEGASLDCLCLLGAKGFLTTDLLSRRFPLVNKRDI